MSKKTIKADTATVESYEANRKIRKSWGEIKPVTRVIGDKRRAKKDKQDRKEMRDYE